MEENNTSYPYRLDICGTWMDSPEFNSLCCGAVICMSIEPTIKFMEGAGMATSTRKRAIELWGPTIPENRNRVELAAELNRLENAYNGGYFNGSQDPIGMLVPGCHYLFYKHNSLWPNRIETLDDVDTLDFLKQHINLIPIAPRREGYNAWQNAWFDYQTTKDVVRSSKMCWQAIQNKDVEMFGAALNKCYDAQSKMCPLTLTNGVKEAVEKYRPISAGCRPAAGGGGGYLLVITEEPIENAIHIEPCKK